MSQELDVLITFKEKNFTHTEKYKKLWCVFGDPEKGPIIALL